MKITRILPLTGHNLPVFRLVSAFWRYRRSDFAGIALVAAVGLFWAGSEISTLTSWAINGTAWQPVRTFQSHSVLYAGAELWAAQELAFPSAPFTGAGIDIAGPGLADSVNNALADAAAQTQHPVRTLAVANMPSVRTARPTEYYTAGTNEDNTQDEATGAAPTNMAETIPANNPARVFIKQPVAARNIPRSSFVYGPPLTEEPPDVSSGAARERRAVSAVSVNQP